MSTNESGATPVRRRLPEARAWWQTFPAMVVRDFAQRRIFWPILKRFYLTHDVYGAENLDELKEPAVFVVVKHASHFDTITMLSSVPPRIRRRLTVAAAKDYFFDRFHVLDKLLELFMNVFPFDRKHSKLSLRQSTDLVKSGWSLVIYGEGTRGTTGEIQKLKRGPAAIVSYSGVAAVPVFMDGPGDILPKGSWCPRRARTIVRFGKVMRFPKGLHSQIINDELEARLHALSRGEDPPADVHLVDWSKRPRRTVVEDDSQ